VTKAVFFDWLNTIAHLKPDRHEIFSQVLTQLGIESSPAKLIRGIYAAETQLPAGAPYRWRESEDPHVFIRYQQIVLAEVGVTLPGDTVLEIVRRISQICQKMSYVLYDDVLPTLKKLKKRGLILGLITNLHKDVDIILSKLGLDPYLDFVVTSREVGADKPAPPIFLAALERARVDASEVVYIGDQYQTDVVGARGVGIEPILIDRYDLMPEVSDCPRIQGLTALAQYHLLAKPEPLAVRWALWPARFGVRWALWGVRLGIKSALWGVRLGVRSALWGVRLALGPALWLWRLVDRPVLWLWGFFKPTPLPQTVSR
jgi:putative hydrolase of the HAD superfamily